MKALVPSGIKLHTTTQILERVVRIYLLELLTSTQPFFHQFPFLLHAVHPIIQEGVTGDLRDLKIKLLTKKTRFLIEM